MSDDLFCSSEEERKDLEEQDNSSSQSPPRDTCYCGGPIFHQWAPTSQCIPPTSSTTSSPRSIVTEPSLLSQTYTNNLHQSDEDLLSSAESVSQPSSSLGSWGVSRFPPSLLDTDVSENDPVLTVQCDGNCATAQALRIEVAYLRAKNEELRKQLEIKVPGYPEYYNIVYEGDEAVYVYRLLLDYEAGDLKVLVQ